MPKLNRWPAIALTFVLGVATTVAAWQYSYKLEIAQQQLRFENEVQEIEEAIINSFNAYKQVLRGGVALFNASEEVTRAEWSYFVTTLATDKYYPGILGIGFAQQLSHERLDKHIAQVRAEGFPDYTVHPLSPDRAPTSIVYLEPFNFRNRRAFGYDMYSNDIRREAMARARDTGEPALSGPVILLQETNVDRQIGTLLYLPMYAKGMPLESLEQRREALEGWVYSPFRMDDLMRGILGNNLQNLGLELYDGPQAEAQQLMHRSSQLADIGRFVPKFSQQRAIRVAGRTWMFRVKSLPGYGYNLVSTPNLILVGGLILTLLVCGLAAALSRAETRAMQLARDMTRALRHSEKQQTAILQNVADGIITINRQCTVQSFNAAAEKMFGYKSKDVIGKNVAMLMPERFRAHHDALVNSVAERGDLSTITMRREVVGRRKNGEEFPIWMSVSRMPTSDGWEFIGMLSDISQRKETEKLLATESQLRKSILQSSPFAIISTDAQGIIQSLNPAAEELLGYEADELVNTATPCVLHSPDELEQHAREVNQRRKTPVECGIDSLLARVREGQMEQREWTYLRKNGSQLPVDVTINALREEDGELAGYLVIAYDITDRRKTQAFIEHMAHHDALTDLPNRTLLYDRLGQAIERAKRGRNNVALIMLDLDNFMRINDSLGHQVGDELLLAMAQRLKATLRRGDTVARMGGDEFVLILSDIQSQATVEEIAKKIIKSVSEPVRVQQHELSITPSLGISSYPDDGDDPHHLLKNADTAMYQAKANGRGGFCMFQPTMLHLNNERLEIENALRKALEQDEFQLQYQPQIRMRDGQLVGSEALLRWHNPELGTIPPHRFIPIAEEMGLIRDIGNWIIHRACADLRDMQMALSLPHLTVAVNISPQQFYSDDLADSILLALSDAQIPPECLEIEITEGTLLENSSQTMQQLNEIRSMGVGVAIDDFGTGYSSLSYITRFPIDKLKIDQSFVRDITHDANDAAITSAIIVMAHTLQLNVVAEGVETREQLDFLRRRRCDIAQGFYYSPSMSPAAFVKFAKYELHSMADNTAQLSRSKGKQRKLAVQSKNG
ncbi:MAG: EAL domain-containing protein [Salinisphaeraceae bacterium]|nr:EAL domain-containing protein [Salinisphaeraceae bacterium]